ncbi:MAG: ABC transporter ATP-binding protein [Pseudomonadota bacterium]
MNIATLITADLAVRLGQRRVLNGVSFAASGGQVVGVLGPNGAGKSTLLKAILKLVPFTGTINISGDQLHDLSAQGLGRRIAYLPQDRDIAWPMNVRAVVDLGRLPHRTGIARPTRADSAAVENAMAAVNVSEFADRRVSELSGGERARVLTARALAQEAPILLADEPTAGLDPAHQIALLAMFRQLATRGLLVVVTLHELDLASRWCDRILLLQEGQLVGDGPPQAVLSRDRIRTVYGCDVHIVEDDIGTIIVPIPESRTDLDDTEAAT